MSDEKEQLFGMMAIVEEQQKAVDGALQKLEQERQALAREREALAEQVKQVAEVTAREVVKSLSGVPQELASGISQAGKTLLASAENAQTRINDAAGRLESARKSLNWRLFAMMIAAMLAVIAVAFVAQWGVTQYYQKQVAEAQQSYDYWNNQATQKYSEAKKHK